MTIFYPDISGFQAGIDLHGTVAVGIKITEGTGYVNPDWRRAKRNAASHNTFYFGYHFLHSGNGAADAKFYRGQTTMPCMLDFEPTTGSSPSLNDACSFIDELRRLGGHVYAVYLPHWYWQQIGSPDLKPLRDRGCFLVSSAYSTYTDSDSGTGWQPYGGMTPQVWQYTDSLRFNGYNVDFNAFRGSYAGKQDSASVAACLAEFRSLVETGRTHDTPKAINPVANLHVTRRGFTTVDLDWTTAKGATQYDVKAYRKSSGHLVWSGSATVSHIRVHHLDPGRTHTIQVRARPGHSTGANATVDVTTR